MTDWQPIETAPKDVEIIGMSYNDYDIFGKTVYGPWTMRWNERKGWEPSWNHCPVIKYMSDFGTEYEELDLEPTHWMPLPSTKLPSPDPRPDTNPVPTR